MESLKQIWERDRGITNKRYYFSFKILIASLGTVCPGDQAAYAIQFFPTSKTIIVAHLDENQTLLQSLLISITSFKAGKKKMCVWKGGMQGGTGNNLNWVDIILLFL